MSSGIKALSLGSDDLRKFLAACTHLGSPNINFQMKDYIFKRTKAGIHLINLSQTWEKLLLAARILVTVKNPEDIFVVTCNTRVQRAVLKYSFYTGATPIAGRFTPGTFSNHVQRAFKEPAVLIVSDPRSDQQPVMEASRVGIPIIAFCNSESPLNYIDVAIPCNNKGQSIGLMFWMLARELLRFRGTIHRSITWEIMPDLFFYREPEEIVEGEEEAVVVSEGDQSNKFKRIAETNQFTSTTNEMNTIRSPTDWATGLDYNVSEKVGDVSTFNQNNADSEWSAAPEIKIPSEVPQTTLSKVDETGNDWSQW